MRNYFSFQNRYLREENLKKFIHRKKKLLAFYKKVR